MNGDQLFQAALAEAKKLAEILPILQGIQENPKEAFEMMVKDRKEIYHLEMNIKKLKEALIESRGYVDGVHLSLVKAGCDPDVTIVKPTLDKIDEALKL